MSRSDWVEATRAGADAPVFINLGTAASMERLKGGQTRVKWDESCAMMVMETPEELLASLPIDE